MDGPGTPSLWDTASVSAHSMRLRALVGGKPPTHDVRAPAPTWLPVHDPQAP